MATQHGDEGASIGDVVVQVDGQVVGSAERRQSDQCNVCWTVGVAAVMSCHQLQQRIQMTSLVKSYLLTYLVKSCTLDLHKPLQKPSGFVFISDIRQVQFRSGQKRTIGLCHMSFSVTDL